MNVYKGYMSAIWNITCGEFLRMACNL